MSDSNPPPVVVQSSGPKVPVILVLVVILIAATGYLFYQLNQIRTDMAQMRDQLLDEISKIHETTAVTTQTSRRSVEALQADLEPRAARPANWRARPAWTPKNMPTNCGELAEGAAGAGAASVGRVDRSRQSERAGHHRQYPHR